MASASLVSDSESESVSDPPPRASRAGKAQAKDRKRKHSSDDGIGQLFETIKEKGLADSLTKNQKKTMNTALEDTPKFKALKAENEALKGKVKASQAMAKGGGKGGGKGASNWRPNSNMWCSICSSNTHWTSNCAYGGKGGSKGWESGKGGKGY